MEPKRVGDNCWWCEWRSHEANIYLEDGEWRGDMIAYGEWGDIDVRSARAVAYAFGLLGMGSRTELDEQDKEMAAFYFGMGVLETA